MRKLIIGVVILVVLLWGGFSLTGYNAIVDHDEDVMAAWSEVENQYQRRAELIPNLVQTVKGVSGFEQETLQAVTEARAKVGSMQVDASMLDDPQRFQQFEQAQTQLSGALSRLLVVAERYPELKATAAYQDLMTQLEGTENRIAVARKRYIEDVAEYNKMVRRFPTSLGASLRGLDIRPTFESTVEGAETAPAVNFE
jgi:LemA protein